MNDSSPRAWRWSPSPEVLTSLSAAARVGRLHAAQLDMARRIAAVYQPQLDRIADIVSTSWPEYAGRIGELVTKSSLADFAEQQQRVTQMAMRPLVEMRLFDVWRTFENPVHEAMARAAELWRQIDPPNWPDGVSWSDMSRLIAETGWSLTYVPRPEVITKLLEADPADRPAILLANAVEIVADCRSCLADVTEPEATHLVVAMGEAFDAFDAGLAIPAQATVASVLTDVINRAFGLSFAAAVRELAEDPGEMPMPHFRFWLVASTIPPALTSFRYDDGDEVPDRFNRHAAAHTVDPRQYTKLNALVGLMLATGLVREIADDMAAADGGDEPQIDDLDAEAC